MKCDLFNITAFKLFQKRRLRTTADYLDIISFAIEAQSQPREPVLGVVVDGAARAYSLWQLDHHEIANDEIAGTAIAATW